MVRWENERGFDSDYFRIYKRNRGDKELNYYLNKIDLDNYWIYKMTDRFRRVEVEDIGKDHIDLWIGYIKKN